MEKLKNKHDHALTQWLKVIIFAILMLAPFFSVLSRCLYVTCNKNAKDSYSQSFNIEYKYHSNEVNNLNDLVRGNVYKITIPQENVGEVTYARITSAINITDGVNFSADLENIDTSWWRLWQSGSTHNLFLSNDRGNVFYTLNSSNITYPYSFEIVYFSNATDYTLFSYTNYNEISNLDINSNGFLDNAFEYSVNQLTQSQTFNWVTNTAIYQPVNAMTTGLGFNANNNILALLLTYWAILTAVYVLFDIIISCFVKITHLVSGNA